MLRLILPIVVILALIGTYFSVFRVQEWEQAIVFEFREVKRTDYEP